MDLQEEAKRMGTGRSFCDPQDICKPSFGIGKILNRCKPG